MVVAGAAIQQLVQRTDLNKLFNGKMIYIPYLVPLNDLELDGQQVHLGALDHDFWPTILYLISV